MTYYFNEFNFTAYAADQIISDGAFLDIGSTFSVLDGPCASIVVVDNDTVLSGDAYRNEIGDDSYGQRANISENGEVVLSNVRIYAEQAYTLHDANGNSYTLIEIEYAGNDGGDAQDYFAFLGDVPPFGAELAVQSVSNVTGHWVDYRDLSAGVSWKPDTNGKITVEAEDMQLSHYREDHYAGASGDTVVKLRAGEGEASLSFGGQSGNYNVEVSFVDENDGQGSIELLLNGVIIETIQLDQDNNGNGNHPGGVTSTTISGLNLAQGDAITLRGRRDGNEFARIDAIRFCPVVADPLFTETNDTVDFNTVLEGDYQDGTQYDALDGDDTVILAQTEAAADAAGYDLTETFSAGAGDDSVTGSDLADTINGDVGSDTLFGNADADVLDGGSGDDKIDGGEGNDQILGGLGDDSLDGGSGNDTIDGGDGDDSLRGGTGDDVLRGGDGDDELDGRSGNDTLEGDEGADVLLGGGGDDGLFGGLGNDTLVGQDGNDTLGSRLITRI